MARCFQVDARDNVATLLDDVDSGAVTVLGGAVGAVDAREAIKLGHKIALRTIRVNEPVTKFGVAT